MAVKAAKIRGNGYHSTNERYTGITCADISIWIVQ